MSWKSKLPRVVSLLPRESAILETHLDSVRAGRAVSPGPSFTTAMHEDLRGSMMAARGELIVHLGLEARAPSLTLLAIEDSSTLGVCDDADAPLAVVCDLASLEGGALLAVLAERPLLLTGSSANLSALAQLCRRHETTLEVAALVVTRLPVMQPVARLLAEAFLSPVLWGIPDPKGGWLAVARESGGPLVGVRQGEALLAVQRDGPVMPEAWGFLATGPADEREIFTHWVRREVARNGEIVVRLRVPPLPIGRTGLDVGALHELFEPLAVFAYEVVIEHGKAVKIRISPLPGHDDARETILAGLPVESMLGDVAFEFIEPGRDFEGAPVKYPRGMFRARATVLWAGEPDSDSRRGGWREAIRCAGFVGSEITLLDAVTDEPVTGLPAEVVHSLGEEPDALAHLLGGEGPQPPIYFGDPKHMGEEQRGAGWITLMPGDEAHEAMFIVASQAEDVAAIQALFESGEVHDRIAELSLSGVFLQGYTRPILGRGASIPGDPGVPWVDDSRCTGAGDCVRICPTDAIVLRGEPARPVIDAAACIKCHLCSERCEVSALRPMLDADSSLDGPLVIREAQMLRKARERAPARALEGKLAEPPAALDKRAPALIKRKPTVVLGLATVTLMEHTAALLVDGELVSAVEEERLVRDRHYNWKHPTRPGTSLSSDICLKVEESWPPRAIDAVLRTAGMTMDDVDIVALNGIPARYRRSYFGGWSWKPPPVLRANSMVFVPHHMAHAACVYGLSGLDDAWILSVDGRGDYETATVWRAEGHELEVIDAVPWRPDCSFGGVYETITRALGFGTHGQGSTMALAALGEPTVDLSSCMSLDEGKRPRLSEWAADALVVPFERGYDDPIEAKHKNLAASLQRALETTVGDYLEHHTGGLRGKNLALCGGVALNCKMNGVLRDRFEPASMHVPPGANDAGTAIGAALIGHRELTGELPRLDLGHTHFGPQWSDDAIAQALQRMRVPFQRLRDVGEQVAQLLVGGKIVCWFQARMEFGPRALGGRSIIADPRREDLKARLNAMKSRQDWRPFGPSVLAGRQADWFVQDWDSRYMLFAIDVLAHKRDEIPVVVHADGSTRPQMVHAEHQPRYHALISAFEQRTGVPMIVNTSFNRGGEPIVCNPAEAMRSFVGLGADAIVLGDCLVRREMLRR